MLGSTSGLSGADVLSIENATNDGRRNDGLFGGGSELIVLILFLLLIGGNGFGGWGGGNNAMANYATQADIVNGFNFSQLDNGIRGLERGLCELGYSTLQQSNQTNMAIAQLGFQQKECCCETNRNIDQVRFENERNTCAITTAIHAEGEQTRALINSNTMQALRDENQAYRLQLSNQAQTANLIATLRPFPQPSYITCSPYESAFNPHLYANGYGYGYGRSACNTCGQCVSGING